MPPRVRALQGIATNRNITDANELLRIAGGNFTLAEAQQALGVTTETPRTLEPTAPVTGGQTGQIVTQTGQPEFDSLLENLRSFLADLQRRGQVINPNIEITPERLAEFMSLAEQEINPFFASQLRLAREGFLQDLGFGTEEILAQEQEAERLHRQSLRSLGEEAAETGFALSGRRQTAERELAETTQLGLERGRRRFEFGAGQAARQFAGLFGGGETTIPTIPGTPQAIPGERSFERTGGVSPLFELNPDVFDRLIGEREFERRGAVRSRASDLERAFRTQQQAQQVRQLVL